MSSVRSLRAGVLACAMLAAAAFPLASDAGASGSPGVHARARVEKAHWRPDAAVRAIAVSRKRVFIAGDFNHVRNVTTGKKVRRHHLAAFRRDTGALLRGFHPHVNGSVDALALLDHKLVVGGDFTAIDGTDREHLGAVNMGSGHVSQNWFAQVDGPVFSLLSMRGEVYVGGDFEHVNAELRTHLFAVDGQGVLSATWPNQAAGTTKGGVYTLAASADRHSVFVGGAFKKLVGSHRTFLGEIAGRSGDVTEWDPTPYCHQSCFVRSLAVDDHLVYAGIAGPGGAITAYRVNTAATKWRWHTNGDVTAVALARKNLILGGHFTLVGGNHRTMFAQLVARTGKLTPRQTRTSGRVYPGILALVVHDGHIRLGGDFTSIAGQHRYAVLPE